MPSLRFAKILLRRSGSHDLIRLSEMGRSQVKKGHGKSVFEITELTEHSFTVRPASGSFCSINITVLPIV